MQSRETGFLVSESPAFDPQLPSCSHAKGSKLGSPEIPHVHPPVSQMSVEAFWKESDGTMDLIDRPNLHVPHLSYHYRRLGFGQLPPVVDWRSTTSVYVLGFWEGQLIEDNSYFYIYIYFENQETGFDKMCCSAFDTKRNQVPNERMKSKEPTFCRSV